MKKHARPRSLGLLGFVFLLILLVACARAAPTATPVPTPTTAPAPAAATATPVVGAPTPTSVVARPTATPVDAAATPTAIVMRAPTGAVTVLMADFHGETWLPRLCPTNPLSPVTDGLLDEDPVTREFLPMLATEWKTEVKADGSVDWTFKLRKGVQFHKGWGEMTAADYKFAMTQYAKPASVSTFARQVVKWYGGDPDNIEVVNDYEFVVHSPEILVTMEELILSHAVGGCNALTVYPKKYLEKVGEDEFSRNPVFTGPYEVVEYKRALHFKIRALEEHWRVVPEFAEVTFLAIPEESTQIAMMRTGRGDLMEISPKLQPEVEAAGLRLVRIKRANATEGWFGGMNLKTRPNYDPTIPWVGEEPTDPKPTKVRQAMNLAIDRQLVVDKLLRGEGEVTNTAGYTFVQGTAWVSPDWKPYPYDPKKAKELLAEAGYPEGFDVNIWLIRWPTRVYEFDVAEATASFWEDIGLKVNRRVSEYRPVVRSRLLNHDTGGWTYMLGNNTSATPWGNACFILGKSTSTIHHNEHPFIDDICARMEAELDFKKRAAMAMELGDWIYRNYWIWPVAYVHRVHVVSSKVGFYEPTGRMSDPGQRIEYARHPR